MSNFEFYGKPIHWDKDLSEITIRTKFLNPDQIQTISDWINNGDTYIRVKVSLVKQFSKTFQQLKKYYADINKILFASGIEINKDNVISVDYELKKSVLDCEIKVIDGRSFIVLPSKSNMTVEDLNFLIQQLEETYSFLGIDFSLPAEVDK